MSQYVEVQHAWLKTAIKKRGYLRFMESCAVADRWEKGERILLFDKDKPCWRDRKKLWYKPKARVGPGTWLRALTTLLFIPHCEKCDWRMKHLDAVGWWGAPRVLTTGAWWRGDKKAMKSRSGCGSCGDGKDKQWAPLTGSAAPTPT